MTFTTSAFSSDHLHLTRWDLCKLWLGFTLRQGALIISASAKPKPRIP